jgi:multiple sugar transport system permease protein
MAIVEMESGAVGAAPRPPRLTLGRREALWGYFFISPWLIGFLLLTLAPMIATLVFTFTNIRLNSDEPLRFVGFDNYEHLLSDQRTWTALGATLKFAAIALPIGLILPFAIALLLNSKSLRGSRYFQTLFFMPYVIPFVAAIFAWGGMLNP